MKTFMKKMIVYLITFTLLIGQSAIVQAVTQGWQKSGASWTYVKANAAKQTGWLEAGGKWYYMASNGVMKTGWISASGKWYYMNGSGAMATGWIKTGSTWYYLNSNGDMAVGWKLLGSTWYYLNTNGDMAANTTIGGYTLGSSGAMVVGKPSTTTGGTTGGNTGSWVPSDGVKTIAGFSSNMTKAQLDARSTEAPSSAIANGSLQGSLLPQDGKLYHYREGIDYGTGMKIYSDTYRMNMRTETTAAGDIRIHVLYINYGYDKIVKFDEGLM